MALFSIRPLIKAAFLSLLLLAGGNALALDVNKASAAELQTVEGVGPVIAERIIKERSRGGKFSSTSDLIARVKGVGEKTASKITKGSGLKKGTTAKSTSSKSTSSKTASKKAAAEKKKPKTTDKKSASKAASSKKAST